MIKMISAILIATTLTISGAALAQKNCPHGKDEENIQRILWAPHIKVFNDTRYTLVVYANNSFMTLNPDDKFDYFFSLTTWGPQPFIIRQDDTEARVIYNEKVPNEVFLHITVIDDPVKPLFKFTEEPMH